MHWRRSALLLAAAGWGLAISAFVATSIVLDGSFGDWQAVLADPENARDDGALGAGDPDSPNSAASDLRLYALTWDATKCYFYFRRGTTSSSGITFLVYIDSNRDWKMETGEPVAAFSFVNSGFQSGDLYRYQAVNPAGDALLGDGVKPPGTVTLWKAGVGSGAKGSNGVEYETSVPWASLELAAQGAYFMQPATSLGANLPNQLQDMGAGVDTLHPGLSLSSAPLAYALPGTTVRFSHTITNGGNASDTPGFTAFSTEGWLVSFFDGVDSLPLGDTNGDGFPDAGMIAPSGSASLTVRVAVPASAPTQSLDTTTVTAISASNSLVQASRDDQTAAGHAALTANSSASAAPGTTVPFSHTLKNLTSQDVSFDLTLSSSAGYTTLLMGDADCDGAPDSGPVSGMLVPAGAQRCLLVSVDIPVGASLGSVGTLTLRATFGSPILALENVDTVRVKKAVVVAPSSSASAGPGTSVFYSVSAENNSALARAVNLAASSSLGWSAAFFRDDRATPLTDSDGDGRVDTGPIGGFGGAASLVVRLTLPAGAAYNTTDTTTVTAYLDSPSVATDSLTLSTQVRKVVTFASASAITYSGEFSPCSTVFAKAFGLGNGTYRFLWYDALSTLLTPAPVEYSPDLSGQILDAYTIGSAPALGSWQVVLQVKAGANWVNMADGSTNFQVSGGGSFGELATSKSVYPLSGAAVGVTAILQNLTGATWNNTRATYWIFRDANGNEQPDSGESLLLSDGSTVSYAGTQVTHLSTSISVPPFSEVEDRWTIAPATFSSTGTWTLRSLWEYACGGAAAEQVSTFLVVFDPTPPFSAISAPLSGATLYLTASPFSVTGTAGDVGSGVSGVDMSVDGGATWAAAGATSGGFSTWSFSWMPSSRGAYILQSRATDAVGNVETPGLGASVTVVDDTPPETPVVTDGGACTASSVQLFASWTSFDLQSGIASYRYAVGTSPGGSDVKDWTAAGLSTSATIGDLALSHGTIYFVSVIAQNLDGWDSAAGASDGITVDLIGPSSVVTDPVETQVLSGASYDIRGTASDDYSGVAAVRVSTDAGFTWNDASATTSWSYAWPLPADGNYTILAQSRDVVGNWGPPSPGVGVTVDNPPFPASNLSALPNKECIVRLSWTESPSTDLDYYAVYHNVWGSPIDYDSPVAIIPAPATSWTSSRGVYGSCGQLVSLASELGQTAKSIAEYTVLNANQENFTISGATVSWTADAPIRFLQKVEIGGVTVFSLPSGSPGNNGSILAFAPTVLAPGATAQVRYHFEYTAGGYPEMTGNTLSVKFTGGSGPTIQSLLQAAGQYPSPCRSGNLESLGVGTNYVFGLRAFDLRGQDDGNTTLTVGSAACAQSLSAAIKSPKVSEKIRGQEVTLYAEVVLGNTWDCVQVKFRYRQSGTGAWGDVMPAGVHSNPDLSGPYFIYWDTAAVPLGNYDLQAVARNTDNFDDPSPPFVTLSVVGASENLLEQRDGGNHHFAAEDVTVASDANRLVVGDDTDDCMTQAWIPKDALASDTRCMVTFAADPGTVPPAWGSGGEFRDVSLASGQVNLANGKRATIEIPVIDTDGNGLVDGTATPLWNLRLYSWNGALWTGVESSQVNLLTKVVRGDSSHFTLFAPLAEPPTADAVAPAVVTGLRVARSGGNLTFTWDPVTLDTGGGLETIHHYNVYRGTAANFTPDKVNRTNLIGVTSAPGFFQDNGVGNAPKYFYLVTAVDTGFNEGN